MPATKPELFIYQNTTNVWRGFRRLWFSMAHRNIDRQRQATYRRLTDAEIKMATTKPEVLICWWRCGCAFNR